MFTLLSASTPRPSAPRKLYLPWEVGKPPDWVLEIASDSTKREDVDRKPGIYALVGVPEYWRFDPTGGRYHGEPLYGGRLVDGGYQAIELTTEPDGILKGHSEILELSLAWDEGWPRFYGPVDRKVSGELAANIRRPVPKRKPVRTLPRPNCGACGSGSANSSDVDTILV